MSGGHIPGDISPFGEQIPGGEYPEEEMKTACLFVQTHYSMRNLTRGRLLITCRDLPDRGARLLYLLLVVILDAVGAKCVQTE